MWVRRKKHRYLHYSISKMSQVPDGNVKGCDCYGEIMSSDHCPKSLTEIVGDEHDHS